MNDVKLIHITPEAEKHVAYCARVSSSNPNNPDYEGLIKYLVKHKHWSPLEMASMCIEINTSRAISTQILRHRSFSFQEFSMRYSQTQDSIVYPARRQDIKNRQNSLDDMSDEDRQWFKQAQVDVFHLANEKYNEALSKGVAKEQARFLLPMSSKTKLFMMGNLRSWVHYIELRTHQDSQLEHRELAEKCKQIFIEQLPIISKALGWL